MTEKTLTVTEKEWADVQLYVNTLRSELDVMKLKHSLVSVLIDKISHCHQNGTLHEVNLAGPEGKHNVSVKIAPDL